MQFSREALSQFLKFATGPEGQWHGNFRDLGRRSAPGDAGRAGASVAEVQGLDRLRRNWNPRGDEASERLEHVLGAEAVEEIDPLIGTVGG